MIEVWQTAGSFLFIVGVGCFIITGWLFHKHHRHMPKQKKQDNSYRIHQQTVILKKEWEDEIWMSSNGYKLIENQ